MKTINTEKQNRILSTGMKYYNEALIRVIPKAEKRPPFYREHPKYDEKYCREKEAAVAGVFFFSVPIMFMFFCVINFVRYEGYNECITILCVGGMTLRIIATLWVARISKEQNRNSVQWMAFAFLLPGSALMIMGRTKKIYVPGQWKQFLYQHNRSIPLATGVFAEEQLGLQKAS